jgi:hypothetical protein
MSLPENRPCRNCSMGWSRAQALQELLDGLVARLQLDGAQPFRQRRRGQRQGLGQQQHGGRGDLEV